MFSHTLKIYFGILSCKILKTPLQNATTAASQAMKAEDSPIETVAACFLRQPHQSFASLSADEQPWTLMAHTTSIVHRRYLPQCLNNLKMLLVSTSRRINNSRLGLNSTSYMYIVVLVVFVIPTYVSSSK